MEYYNKITELTKNISPTLVDFSEPRGVVRVPTQASSEFITNKEQGDWAENLIFTAINESIDDLVAIKYGKSDGRVAGEEGFDDFFKEFQFELDTIGKRPDLLIFKKKDFDSNLGYDISNIPHYQITEYVKKSIAGIEVRSSAFLIESYELFMKARSVKFSKIALDIKDQILSEYADLLEAENRKKYISILNSLTQETLSIFSFRVPGWSANERLIELNECFRNLKDAVEELQKRTHLSITPKVEDIKVVYKWIETFNVPHFYFQVFFDKVYGISFENILNIISDSNNEDKVFEIEKDTKNQNKTTIKINPKSGLIIAKKVDEPNHSSKRKELNRGRLLFYVSFEGGTAYLDIDNLKSILKI